MFERFTDRARRVVVLSQEEARRFKHGYIGAEHILLGLLSEKDGVAAQALTGLGISLPAMRSRIPAGTEYPTGHIPFDADGKRTLELSLPQALRLGHNYIGTEHLLLGIVAVGEDSAAHKLLAAAGIELADVRKSVIDILAAGWAAAKGGTANASAAASRQTGYDVTLDWIPGEPDHKYWWGQVPFRARHRDGIGSYYITRFTPQPFVVVKVVDGVLTTTGELNTPPSEWHCEWQKSAPNGNIYGPVPISTSQDLEEVKAAAVEHHRTSRREQAWERYMLDNDPPVVHS